MESFFYFVYGLYLLYLGSYFAVLFTYEQDAASFGWQQLRPADDKAPELVGLWIVATAGFAYLGIWNKMVHVILLEGDEKAVLCFLFGVMPHFLTVALLIWRRYYVRQAAKEG